MQKESKSPLMTRKLDLTHNNLFYWVAKLKVNAPNSIPRRKHKRCHFKEQEDGGSESFRGPI